MDEDGNTRASKDDKAAFTLTRGEVDNLGIHYEWQRGEETYRWRHVEKNIKKGTIAIDEIEQTPTQLRTWRQAARIAGVLIWDWVLSQEPRRSQNTEIEISHTIGKEKLKSRKAWDKPAKIDTTAWNNILSKLKEKLTTGDRTHSNTKQPNNEDTINCASDTCKQRGAGVDLRDNSVLMINFDRTEEGMHITRKETIAALRTLLWILRKRKTGEKYKHVIIALDNTTAVTALNEKIVYLENEVDKLLMDVQDEYEEAGRGKLFTSKEQNSRQSSPPDYKR